MSSRNLYLDPFLIAKSSLAFPCGPCLLEDRVVHDGELDLLINLINLCLQFTRWSDLISWMIKKLVVLALFQPRPPWTLEWCRCWDCCGWSWSYHLKLNTLAVWSSWGMYLEMQREKNLDERKTYRVDHPGWLLRQLALDSPSCTFLADEP